MNGVEKLAIGLDEEAKKSGDVDFQGVADTLTSALSAIEKCVEILNSTAKPEEKEEDYDSEEATNDTEEVGEDEKEIESDEPEESEEE